MLTAVTLMSNLLSASQANPRFIHIKARFPYVDSKGQQVLRTVIPDEKVPWNVPFPDYKPVHFSDPFIEGKIWADPDVATNKEFKLKFNQLDGKINRKSFEGDYVVESDVPKNPFGRTGMHGRGLLGRWGPNHAADPVVTRWKRDDKGNKFVHPETKKPILQFVSICRRDNKEWAIPGGMVDAGEHVSVTCRREFNEEAMAGFDPAERSSLAGLIDKFFARGEKIYEGYVDDPRNTDNAWMETTVYNFHDADGSIVGRFPLAAGDDAGAIRWSDISRELQLYASHANFIQKVAERHDAHW